MLNLYESEKLSNVTGSTLRPGGLDLTLEMLEVCRLEPYSMVLDMGCGHGTTLALLDRLGHCPYGVDISTTLLGKAMDVVPKAILARASADKTPFSETFFDLVLAECVLSLMSPPDDMLKEARRVLKPKGLLSLTDIYLREVREGADCDLSNLKCCLKGALELDELKELIEKNNFEIIHVSDHTDKLKQLTAQLIFAYGSLKNFWEFFVGPKEAEAVTSCNHKYGYYMLVARKKDG